MIPLQPRDFTIDGTDGDDPASAVRPYALTGGRTRSGTAHLPVEALVQGLAPPDAVATTPERRRILELTRDQYLSVAELSAYLAVPVGVVRVLVGDLADEGLVRVPGLSPSTTSTPAMSLSVLESVLNGISSL